MLEKEVLVMSSVTARASPLIRLGLTFGLAGIGLAAFSQPRVDAAAGSCRSDPVIVVNTAVVDVVSTLSTDPSLVRELDYTVTVPLGSLINRTTLTVGLGFPEKVSYVFSPFQPWGTMRIDARVVMAPGAASFQTSVQASSLLVSSTANGLSNGQVTVNLGGLLML
jgi:hypothetical protein